MDDHFGSCVRPSYEVEQMQLVRNLIEVKISDQQLNAANFTDGIQIQVRSEKPFTVNAYWIVKIVDIHSEIGKDWKTMRDELWDNKFLSEGGKSLYRNEPQINQQSNEQTLCNIKPPKPIDTSNMKETPRDFYPLVIIVTCHEEEANPQATDAAANIHIVHIKDSVVPIKSHVIKQYIKQVDGKILDISQLYVEDTAACFICFEEANPDEGLQLFCLLPCRHSPICSNCVKRIHECPKCRWPIAKVFDINAPLADRVLSTSSEQPGIDANLRHLYDNNEESSRSSRTREQKGILSSIKSLFGF